MKFINNFKRKKNRFKKRDYSIKSLINPFFKIDKKNIKKKFNFILIIIIIILIIFFIGFSQYFSIKNIEINGASKITKNFIKEIAEKQQNKSFLWVFHQDRLLFFNIKEFKNSINNQLVLKNIKISKKWPHNINIYIKEKTSEYYLINQEQIFTLDEDGNLILILDKIPKKPILPVLNFNNGRLKIGNQVVNKKYLNEVKNIYKLWQEKHLQPKIKYINLDEKVAKQITVMTVNNFEIYFSREYDINSQLKNYYNLYLKEIKNKKKIKYIDFRVKDWIYYK